MSILTHPMWTKVKPYIRIEEYEPDGKVGKARIRIEVITPAEPLRTEMLAMTMPCVRCGDDIHPIRARTGPSGRGAVGNLYFAPTCPLDTKIGCSRGKAAATEYNAIREAMGF